MLRARWLFGLVVLAAPTTASAQVVLPNQSINGVSQAVLADRWWQWALSYPNGANPITDTTGAFSFRGADQTPAAHPGVFYLAGNFGNTNTRTVTIPPNQFLFFPLVNVISDIPAFGANEAAVRADAAATLGTVSGLVVTLNGANVPLPPPTTSLLNYRQTTPPGTFPITYIPNNIFGAPTGTFQAVSDGYWVGMQPLAPGNYTLVFGGSGTGTPPTYPPFDISPQTYQITVVPEPSTIMLTGLAATAGLIGRRWRGRRPDVPADAAG